MITVGFYCDECGVGYEMSYSPNDPLPTKYMIFRRAREKGFTVGKRILCPKCRRGGKKND
jgi:hypothetical protein